MQKLGEVAAFLWVTAPSCGCMGNGGPDPGFSVPLLSLTTPWTAAYQASLSISNSGSFLTLAGDRVRSWDGKIPWRRERLTHSSILAWRMPPPVQSMGPQHSSLENSTAFQPGEFHSIPAWRMPPPVQSMGPQHSSLENAAACTVHGVAKSQTQLSDFHFMPIESLMPSNHLLLCRPLLLPPSVFPSIRGFSKESVLCVRWPKYWSFSISPSTEHSGLISFRMDWLALLAVQGTLKSLPRFSL